MPQAEVAEFALGFEGGAAAGDDDMDLAERGEALDQFLPAAGVELDGAVLRIDAPPTTPDPDTMPDLIETPYGVLGTPLPPTSKWLKEAIADADLVIAKGSANYETFVAKAAKVATVVYLLRVKCEPVAESIGVPVGSLVLLKQAGQPKTGVVKRADLEKSDEG